MDVGNSRYQRTTNNCNEGGSWIRSTVLPSPYRGYDLYLAHKIVINEPTPYRHNRMYCDKYASFKSRRDQQPTRAVTKHSIL